MMKKLKNLSLSTKMALFFTIILAIIGTLLYNVMPRLLNYPPDTINTSFDREVSITYYIYQFAIAMAAIAIVMFLYFKISLRKLDKWWKNKKYDKDTILEVRRKCSVFPYRTYMIIEILPVTLTLLVLGMTGSHPEILMFKIGTLVFSFSTLVGALFLIFVNKLLYPFLVETSEHLKIKRTNKFLSLKTKLVVQLFPGILITALLVSLIGYATLTREKGDLLNSYYKTTLDNAIADNSQELINNIENADLSNYLMNDTDFFFIEYPDGTIKTSDGTELTYFFIKYMHDLAPTHDNRVYESYTIDAQGVIDTIEYQNEKYTIGIYYEILSMDTFFYFLMWSAVLFIFNFMVLMYVTSSLQKDIQNVAGGMNSIIKNPSNITDSKLPITSNDILGDLSIAFNSIQDLTKNNIDQIHASQDILVERERLASLGQMIGGIAHNLKTPIMSISGAAEGLTDLIKEYDASIGDSDVTEQDHHEIAKEMREWVDKLRDHTSYMSDVITAVKGQAVTLGDNQAVDFTIEELVKRVDILMKHELKNALVDLNIFIGTNEKTVLKGNINSLVQVINNMISNAIQSYGGKANQKIDMRIEKDKKNIIIEITDYGCGLPKKVQEKLFKEMITTKGKNGTGLDRKSTRLNSSH